jgi:predicted CoA-substrate-specific enzyme activase
MQMSKFYGGCDIGSTTGKAVVLKDDRIVGSAIVPSTVDPVLTAQQAFAAAFEHIDGLDSSENLDYLIGTGYGRSEVPFANENISEISCHAMGAFFCDSSIKTIVDIGGQDVKAISLNEDGTVRDFAMNDKCAAGTGRFFESMARIFQLSLDEMSELAVNATKVEPITTQCSVFAETEVISLLNSRVPAENIAAGINHSISKRVFGLARKAGIIPSVTVTGGCAKNPQLVKTLAKTLRSKMVSLDVDPQLMGALGAAVYAKKNSCA